MASDEGAEEDGDADVELPGRLGGGGEVLGGHEQEGRGGKEAHDGGAEAGEDVLYGGVVLILHQELGDEEHKDEGGQDDGEGGRGRAEDAHEVGATAVDDGGVAYVGGGIDADGTGGHLRHGDDVGELTHGHPVVVGDYLTLDHGDHGVAAAEAEEADEEEGVEELEVKQV